MSASIDPIRDVQSILAGVAEKPEPQNPVLRVLYRSRQIMIVASKLYQANYLSDAQFCGEAQRARRIVSDSLKRHPYKNQPALWLRRAELMEQDFAKSPSEKLSAVERAARMMELGLDEKLGFPFISFIHPKEIKAIACLAVYCEAHDRQDLSLRLLDVLDRIDPKSDYDDQRNAMRTRCKQLTTFPRDHVRALRPDGISPTVVPPALWNDGPR